MDDFNYWLMKKRQISNKELFQYWLIICLEAAIITILVGRYVI